MKNKKELVLFCVGTYNIGNFEAFHWNILLSAIFLFLKSDKHIVYLIFFNFNIGSISTKCNLLYT